MEPGGLCSARAMSLMDSPAFHRFHNSFLPAADNPPGRPSLATLAPPIRTTPKTLACCTDRLNPPRLFSGSPSLGGGSYSLFLASVAPHALRWLTPRAHHD